MYGQSMMEGTRETLLKWVDRLSRTTVDRSEGQHPVWIVPVPFCAMHHVKNSRFSQEMKREQVTNF